MITADALARELGCTIADLEDLNVTTFGIDLSHPSNIIGGTTVEELRAAWSKKTGVDYTETAR